ncbi:DNA-binding protein H-NS [Burkholderia cenocepacia PC184]|nr:DNA-binding protein H-NS [Burkholderia cenocepacia PC184]
MVPRPDSPGPHHRKGESKNVSIRETQGADRRSAGPGGRRAPPGSGSGDRRCPANDCRIWPDGPGPGLRGTGAARTSAEEGAIAAEIPRSEVGCNLEWARQAAELDRRQKPRSFPDRVTEGQMERAASTMRLFCFARFARRFRRGFTAYFGADFRVRRPRPGAMPVAGLPRKAIRKSRRNAAPLPSS